MEATVGNLVALTREFFAKHWNADAIGCAPPEWSGEYRFVGSMPNHEKQGVYAFVKGDQVTYIGVATSKGGGRYRGHGLGKRFQAYAKVIDGAHTPVDPRLIDAAAPCLRSCPTAHPSGRQRRGRSRARVWPARHRRPARTPRTPAERSCRSRCSLGSA